MQDHEDTPDDRPDPADERQEELKQTDNDISRASADRTGDDSADAEQAAVDDATNNGQAALSGGVLGLDLDEDLLHNANHGFTCTKETNRAVLPSKKEKKRRIKKSAEKPKKRIVRKTDRNVHISNS